jgi:hypothetical protein
LGQVVTSSPVSRRRVLDKIRRPGLRDVLSHPHGPTKWQINYWGRKGYIDLEGEGRYAAPIPVDVQRQLIEMARLCSMGLSHAVAARLTQTGYVQKNGRRVIPAAPGVFVILEPPE